MKTLSNGFLSLLFIAFLSFTHCQENDPVPLDEDDIEAEDDVDNNDDHPNDGSNDVVIDGPIDQAKVYWVGHSLISGRDPFYEESQNLMEVLQPLCSGSNKTYDYYQHTTPGAPIGWNWGAVPDAWNGGIDELIQPLINESHSDYGSFDAIVVTEGVDIQSSYEFWASSFYARKFFAASRRANPEVRLFLYESWHHYNGSDNDFRNYYGPMEDFDWRTYMLDVHEVWEQIVDGAADPALTQSVPDYVYQGTGEDPGISDEIFEINLIPTGMVLVNVLDRLAENREEDDWSYPRAAVDGLLSAEDFWVNPLANFPDDLSTTVHEGVLDDIHPSHVLVYLNGLVHYSVIYRTNPSDLPAVNGVPEPIADIFKEVVWETVTSDPRTGLVPEE